MVFYWNGTVLFVYGFAVAYQWIMVVAELIRIHCGVNRSNCWQHRTNTPNEARVWWSRWWIWMPKRGLVVDELVLINDSFYDWFDHNIVGGRNDSRYEIDCGEGGSRDSFIFWIIAFAASCAVKWFYPESKIGFAMDAGPAFSLLLMYAPVFLQPNEGAAIYGSSL